MTITVENGTIVASANSYGSVDALDTFAQARGVKIKATAEEMETYLIQAMDYIEAQADKFQGVITDADQALQWPRAGVCVYGLSVGANSIPFELINAQYQLAIEVYGGNDLQPTRLPADKGNIIEETVGPVKVVYESSKTAGFTPAFAKAEALLSHLYTRSGLSLVRT